ncbi:MAG: hypothetical protein M3355_00280 [Actinomycetota bacterium]|nr:hypothetical protein [Actinomycetota bacterium]
MADQMTDDSFERALSATAREAAGHFTALSPEIRGCAIIGPRGLAGSSSGDEAGWIEAARALLEAADRAAGTAASHAHVATEEGEAYAIRQGDFAMVAVTDRFTLASLVFADMRAALREAARAIAPATAQAA